MADFGDEAIGASERSRGRPFWRRRWFLAAAIAVVPVVALVWFGFILIGSESSDQRGGLGESGDDVTVMPGRKYSDEELGMDQLVSEQLTQVWAQFRSLGEWNAHLDEQDRYFHDEAYGHERERLNLERNVAWLLSNAYEDLPADLGSGGILDQAFETAMDECADAAGWPNVTLYGVSQSDVEAFGEQFGLTLDGFLDLRHECSRQAASYPTLDPAVRDELLDRLREHYRRAIHDYLREFPEAEVPLVDHPGAPRPLEERLISICLKQPDPVPCAQEYRVELPAE